jgi:hypothetical protein
MRSIGVRKARTLMLAIGLLVAVPVYVGAQSSAAAPASGLASQGTAAAPPGQASRVEAEIARTNLTARVEAALGADFAGIWFEPSAARVHVGFTSPAARRAAEAVAAGVGLAEAVTETRVRSTWAQLHAAQERWGRHLGDLFERGEVATSLAADRNSVEVELGSSVPSSRRAALERAAAVDRVGVAVTVASRPQLSLAPEARCSVFKAGAANCDPSIVAGVTIMSPKEAEAAEEFEEEEELGEYLDEGLEYEEYEAGKKRFPCTAGPDAILRNPADLTEATKTYLLTAGHCINEKKGGGGVGGKWGAFEKKGPESEIGAAIAYLNGRTDVGAIEVNTSFWAKAKDPIPVAPTIATWGSKAESDPFPVILQITPLENAKTCISGQRSAIVCGKILTASKSIKSKIKGGPKIENLVEVGVAAQKGDSGGPWFAESEYNKEPRTGYVEGTHVGLNTGSGNALFQPLYISFAELEKESGLDLELLTQTNQRRHPALTAVKYSATVSGKGSASLFTAFGTSVKCTESEFDGVLSGEATSIELTPVYVGCTGVGGGPATVTSNGCKYKLSLQEKVAEGQYKAAMDIVCPVGKAGIELHTYANKETHASGTALCRLTVPPQSGLKSVMLTNSSGKIVLDSGTIEGIKIKIHRINKLLCPSSGTENETATGAYDIEKEVTLSGSSEGKAVEIDMAGG